MRTSQKKQFGLGYFSVILTIAAILFVVILGMKLVPPYLHNMQIERILNIIASDSEMQSASDKEIRASYSKRAMMDYISDLSADDIEVNKENGHISLSANYMVKIAVVANISLLLEFSPHSTK